MFEQQNIRKDTVSKDSSSGDNSLLGLFESRKTVSQGINVLNKLFQQKNKYQLVTDPKKPPQVYGDELLCTRTNKLKEDKDHKSSQSKKIVEHPLIGDFADQDKYIQEFKYINTKKILNEEEKRRKDFEKNLNKLALFAYEAEEGTEVLESGQNPFLEEVDRLLLEIDSESKPFPEEVDWLLQEIGCGTKPLSEKEYENLEQRNQQKKQRKSTDSGYTVQQEQRRK
jgi:hypothetical protein